MIHGCTKLETCQKGGTHSTFSHLTWACVSWWTSLLIISPVLELLVSPFFRNPHARSCLVAPFLLSINKARSVIVYPRRKRWRRWVDPAGALSCTSSKRKIQRIEFLKNKKEEGNDQNGGECRVGCRQLNWRENKLSPQEKTRHTQSREIERAKSEHHPYIDFPYVYASYYVCDGAEQQYER